MPVSLTALFVSSRKAPRRALSDETKTAARETNFLQMALENKSDGEHLLKLSIWRIKKITGRVPTASVDPHEIYLILHITRKTDSIIVFFFHIHLKYF